MPSVPNSPLTDEHLQAINKALAAIAVAETQVLLAQQAGIDVKAQEAQISDAKTKLRALKNTYFPGAL